MSASDKIEARDLGLLIMRVGLGAAMLVHGWPKLMGGTETWSQLGGVMGLFGITAAPTFWGFMAALAEFGGGLALITGIAFPIFMAMLFINMVVATSLHFVQGADFNVFSHALELAIVFLGMLFMGPGKLAVCFPRSACGCTGGCGGDKQPPA